MTEPVLRFSNGVTIVMCYMDMTFCSSDCTRKDCKRHFDEQDRQNAVLWWGTDNPPVAFSDFSSMCKDYLKPESTSCETSSTAVEIKS